MRLRRTRGHGTRRLDMDCTSAGALEWRIAVLTSEITLGRMQRHELPHLADLPPGRHRTAWSHAKTSIVDAMSGRDGACASSRDKSNNLTMPVGEPTIKTLQRLEKVGMRALVLTLVLVFAADSSTVADSHEMEVGGFALQRKIEEPDQQLTEVETVNVTMRCFSGEDGHRITITASNLEDGRHVCQSRCYYRTSSGLSGLMYGSATVPMQSKNVEFRTDYFKDFTVSITNPGSFSCR